MIAPTEILRDEHTLILRALDTLEAAAADLAGGLPVPESRWTGLIEWLRAFADRTHHVKEEQALFPALVKAGLPTEGGPIGVMLDEHAEGRGLIEDLAAPDPGQRARSARAYVALLRAHIAKENEVLFPLADAVLEPDAQRALGREFEAIADVPGRGGSLARASRALDRLAGTVRSEPARRH
jgi:hemerythrin-like domain-containing protein